MEFKEKKKIIYIVIAVILIVLESGAFSASSTGREKPGDFQSMSLNYDTVDGIQRCTLTGRFLRDVDGEDVYMQPYKGSITIYKNGTEIYQDDILMANGDDYLFSSEWIVLHAVDFTTEDKVEISMYGSGAELSVRQIMSTIYVGDGLGLLKKMLHKNIFHIFVAILIGILGMTYAATLVALREVRKEIPGGYLSCALLLISGAVCTMIDYDYITLLFSDVRMVNQVDYLSQVMICISLMFYLTSFVQSKLNRRIMNVFSWILVVSVPLFYILNWTVGVTMKDYLSGQMPLAVLIMGIGIAMVFRDYKEYSQESIRTLFQSGLALGMTAILEIVHYYIATWYWIWVFQLGLLMFSIVQFWILIKESKLKFQQVEQAERKLADSRIAIMLSQIQPHFLYNALAAIAVLCRKDPVAAQRATTEFAKYLRGNINSLNQRAPVPFETELEHIRIYLKLEKMRFQEELNVVYDIQTTEFMVPSLTIQPLVENAVKYGVGEKDGGGTVTISTRACRNYIEVVIEDDGVGYNAQLLQQDGRAHIGIENVRTRLMEIGGATLDISSRAGKGTVVVIQIPQKVQTEEKNEHEYDCS